jgi:putative endonuclease
MDVFTVFVMTNLGRSVLYTGLTDDFPKCMAEHKAGKASRFAAKYKVRFLLYFEAYPKRETAAARFAQIKSWRRERKIALIREKNPDFSFIDPATSGRFPS